MQLVKFLCKDQLDLSKISLKFAYFVWEIALFQFYSYNRNFYKIAINKNKKVNKLRSYSYKNE